MSNYLTIALSISIYQPISLMSNYLTTASASTTYQLQTSSSINTYQPKSDMNNYVNSCGNQNINGIKTFESLLECVINPNSKYQLVNKNYVD